MNFTCKLRSVRMQLSTAHVKVFHPPPSMCRNGIFHQQQQEVSEQKEITAFWVFFSGHLFLQEGGQVKI